jgi:hypothetical protein
LLTDSLHLWPHFLQLLDLEKVFLQYVISIERIA